MQCSVNCSAVQCELQCSAVIAMQCSAVQWLQCARLSDCRCMGLPAATCTLRPPPVHILLQCNCYSAVADPYHTSATQHIFKHCSMQHQTLLHWISLLCCDTMQQVIILCGLLFTLHCSALRPAATPPSLTNCISQILCTEQAHWKIKFYHHIACGDKAQDHSAL